MDSGADGSEAKDPEELWRETTAGAKLRFEEGDVGDEDIQNAIEWARSQ
jgi:hypothetical protein